MGGTPSHDPFQSISMDFFSINHPFGGTPSLETPMCKKKPGTKTVKKTPGVLFWMDDGNHMLFFGNNGNHFHMLELSSYFCLYVCAENCKVMIILVYQIADLLLFPKKGRIDSDWYNLSNANWCQMNPTMFVVFESKQIDPNEPKPGEMAIDVNVKL